MFVLNSGIVLHIESQGYRDCYVLKMKLSRHDYPARRDQRTCEYLQILRSNINIDIYTNIDLK